MKALPRLGLAALFLFAACETDGGDDYPVGPGGTGGTVQPGGGGPGVDAPGGGSGGSGDARPLPDANFDGIGPADSPRVPDSPLVPDSPTI